MGDYETTEQPGTPTEVHLSSAGAYAACGIDKPQPGKKPIAGIFWSNSWSLVTCAACLRTLRKSGAHRA